MSILSKFISQHLVPTLEEEFKKHEPQLQQKLLEEVEALLAEIAHWLKEKVVGKDK